MTWSIARPLCCINYERAVSSPTVEVDDDVNDTGVVLVGDKCT